MVKWPPWGRILHLPYLPIPKLVFLTSVVLYRYMYCISTSSGARATFLHHARAEETLQYSSLIVTEELTEPLKPAGTVPL